MTLIFLSIIAVCVIVTAGLAVFSLYIAHLIQSSLVLRIVSVTVATPFAIKGGRAILNIPTRQIVRLPVLFERRMQIIEPATRYVSPGNDGLPALGYSRPCAINCVC